MKVWLANNTVFLPLTVGYKFIELKVNQIVKD
jgi:hypothetical protein